MNVTPCELIDCQVDDGNGLKHEETVILAPLLQYPIVVSHTNDHENYHQGALEDNPCLLCSVRPVILICCVIEFIISDWIQISGDVHP